MFVVGLMAQTGGEGQIAQIARTFGVDWPHLGAQIVSFGIVCAVLYWLAYTPILRMLEERRQQILTVDPAHEPIVVSRFVSVALGAVIPTAARQPQQFTLPAHRNPAMVHVDRHAFVLNPQVPTFFLASPTRP